MLCTCTCKYNGASLVCLVCHAMCHATRYRVMSMSRLVISASILTCGSMLNIEAWLVEWMLWLQGSDVGRVYIHAVGVYGMCMRMHVSNFASVYILG